MEIISRDIQISNKVLSNWKNYYFILLSLILLPQLLKKMLKYGILEQNNILDKKKRNN